MKLWKKNIIGLLFGLIIGIFWHEGAGLYKAINTLFLNSLKMVAIPLVFFSLINAIGNFTSGIQIKSTTIRSLLLFFGSGIFASLLALGIALIAFLETVQKHTEVVVTKFSFDVTNIAPNNFFSHFIHDQIQPIILLGLFIAYAIGQLKKKSDTRLISNAITEITGLLNKMLEIVISFLPLGITGAVAMLAATIKPDMITKLLSWILVLILTYLIQMIFFVIVIRFATKLSPIPFFKKSIGCQVLALATGSSKASLPMAMQQSRDRLGISSEKAMLLLPLGASINMIGLGIYLTITIIFLSNLAGVRLELFDYILLVFLATIAPLGTAGVAGGAITILPVLLGTMGVSLEGVALIMVIDPLINGIRTMINVTGDIVIVMLVDIWDKDFNYQLYKEY